MSPRILPKWDYCHDKGTGVDWQMYAKVRHLDRVPVFPSMLHVLFLILAMGSFRHILVFMCLISRTQVKLLVFKLVESSKGRNSKLWYCYKHKCLPFLFRYGHSVVDLYPLTSY